MQRLLLPASGPGQLQTMQPRKKQHPLHTHKTQGKEAAKTWKNHGHQPTQASTSCQRSGKKLIEIITNEI